MSKINKASINTKLSLSISKNTNALRVLASHASDKMEIAKQEMVSDFLNHAVTEEIAAGEKAENISGTLGGYGNLFSFIGFLKGSTPISNFASYLQERFKMGKVAKVEITKVTEKGIEFESSFEALIPSKEEIGQKTQMDWEPRSWLWGIEQGLSGLGQYLYNVSGFRGGRSSTGLQNENSLRSARYKRQSYFSEILAKFLLKISSKKR